MDFFQRMLFRFNSYRKVPPTVTELYLNVKEFLPRDPVILEAGAHMGFDTYGLSKVWPSGQIHAFEPVPSVYDSLVQRVMKCKNVKTYNIALGKENGTAEMYVSGGTSTASSSLLQPSKHLNLFPSVTFADKINVQLKKMDDWLHDQNLDRVDLLWLDMQGYEVNALLGATKILQKASVIYTELCKTELYAGLVTQEDYIAFLKQRGFELVSVTGDGEVSEGIFVNSSVIATRNN
jgi:FkbM family methyltransferase